MLPMGVEWVKMYVVLMLGEREKKRLMAFPGDY